MAIIVIDFVIAIVCLHAARLRREQCAVLLVRLVRLVLFIALLLIVRSPLGQPAVCLAISDSPPPSLHDYSIQLDIWTQQCPILHDASSVPF